MKKCKDCKYMFVNVIQDSYKEFTCRYNPPKVMLFSYTANYDAYGDRVESKHHPFPIVRTENKSYEKTEFPQVDPDRDWCGQWKPI